MLLSVTASHETMSIEFLEGRESRGLNDHFLNHQTRYEKLPSTLKGNKKQLVW